MKKVSSFDLQKQGSPFSSSKSRLSASPTLKLKKLLGNQKEKWNSFKENVLERDLDCAQLFLIKHMRKTGLLGRENSTVIGNFQLEKTMMEVFKDMSDKHVASSRLLNSDLSYNKSQRQENISYLQECLRRYFIKIIHTRDKISDGGVYGKVSSINYQKQLFLHDNNEYNTQKNEIIDESSGLLNLLSINYIQNWIFLEDYSFKEEIEKSELKITKVSSKNLSISQVSRSSRIQQIDSKNKDQSQTIQQVFENSQQNDQYGYQSFSIKNQQTIQKSRKSFENKSAKQNSFITQRLRFNQQVSLQNSAKTKKLDPIPQKTPIKFNLPEEYAPLKVQTNLQQAEKTTQSKWSKYIPTLNKRKSCQQATPSPLLKTNRQEQDQKQYIYKVPNQTKYSKKEYLEYSNKSTYKKSESALDKINKDDLHERLHAEYQIREVRKNELKLKYQTQENETTNFKPFTSPKRSQPIPKMSDHSQTRDKKMQISDLEQSKMQSDLEEQKIQFINMQQQKPNGIQNIQAQQSRHQQSVSKTISQKATSSSDQRIMRLCKSPNHKQIEALLKAQMQNEQIIKDHDDPINVTSSRRPRQQRRQEKLSEQFQSEKSATQVRKEEDDSQIYTAKSFMGSVAAKERRTKKERLGNLN